MELNNVQIGFAYTGSFCTFSQAISAMETLIAEKAKVQVLFSHRAANTNTRFGRGEDWVQAAQEQTGQDLIQSIVDAEPVGPEGLFDLLVIAPCTGNTLAKLANGITDDTVLMAAKAQLRNCKPVLIAIATNDGLGFNAINLGRLLPAKNIFFVPFGQDSPEKKQNSLLAHMNLVLPAAKEALQGRQIQPLLRSYT